LPWLIGPKQAKELLLTASDQVTAQRAYELGLVNEVTHGGAHLQRALEVAQAMAGYSAMSVQMTKKAINRSLDIAGMRQALLAAIDTATLIEANVRPENVEFERIRSTEGMKAALAWRDAKAQL
jgi:enoyl-CoA hydratase